MNIKKNLPKVLSAAMSLTILCSGVSVASYAAGAESTGVKTEAPKTAETKKTAEKSRAIPMATAITACLQELLISMVFTLASL